MQCLWFAVVQMQPTCSASTDYTARRRSDQKGWRNAYHLHRECQKIASCSFCKSPSHSSSSGDRGNVLRTAPSFTPPTQVISKSRLVFVLVQGLQGCKKRGPASVTSSFHCQFIKEPSWWRSLPISSYLWISRKNLNWAELEKTTSPFYEWKSQPLHISVPVCCYWLVEGYHAHYLQTYLLSASRIATSTMLSANACVH